MLPGIYCLLPPVTFQVNLPLIWVFTFQFKPPPGDSARATETGFKTGLRATHLPEPGSAALRARGPRTHTRLSYSALLLQARPAGLGRGRGAASSRSRVSLRSQKGQRTSMCWFGRQRLFTFYTLTILVSERAEGENVPVALLLVLQEAPPWTAAPNPTCPRPAAASHRPRALQVSPTRPEEPAAGSRRAHSQTHAPPGRSIPC